MAVAAAVTELSTGWLPKIHILATNPPPIFDTAPKMSEHTESAINTIKPLDEAAFWFVVSAPYFTILTLSLSLSDTEYVWVDPVIGLRSFDPP